jgi:hypothetical protein
LVVVIVAIMILIINKTLNTLVGYSNSLRTQATRKLTSPSAVQFVQGYALDHVCCGFVQAHAWRWSAVRLVLPNVLNINSVRFNSESVKGRESN